MTARKLLLAGMLLLLVGVAAQASYPYYASNKWHSARSPRGNYYYSHYYYGPGVNQYHHAYYYPYKSRRYVYYYNWEKRRYWGRYDLESGKYSLLAREKRKENINEIAEADFPAPAALHRVVIPGSEGTTMTAPPRPPE